MSMSEKAEEPNEEEIEWPDLLGELTRGTVKLGQVYLDPNNPRFGEGRAKSESRITEPAVQKRAMERLEKDVGIDDLIPSIKTNGFLPVDTVVVREFEAGKFVVVEGNRRICALKRLTSDVEAGDIELPETITKSLAEFEVLVYKGNDPDISWRIQGLRHILGIRSWGPLQEAISLEKRLQQIQIERKGRGRPPGVAAVARAIGVQPSKASVLLRSLWAFRQCKLESEYADKLTSDQFSVFNEAVFRRETLWKWLGWDDATHLFENIEKVDRLLDWLLPHQENGKEVPPRIRRVNPDLRDVLPQMIHQPAVMARFEAGQLTMEQAAAELQAQISNAAPEEAESYLRRLDELEKLIETLPLPTIFREGKSDRFLERLGRIRAATEFQERLLKASPS